MKDFLLLNKYLKFYNFLPKAYKNQKIIQQGFLKLWLSALLCLHLQVTILKELKIRLEKWVQQAYKRAHNKEQDYMS